MTDQPTSGDIPTPETDAAYIYEMLGVAEPLVRISLAEDLERRLAAATARAEEAERIIRNGEEQAAALKRLVPFCHHPANLVIGSAEGWICCECWAQQNEDALRKIAALPTDQTASPTQCEAVLIAMDALEASPSVRPNELQSKLTTAEAQLAEAQKERNEAKQADYWGRKYDSAMKELEIEFRRTTDLRAEVERLRECLQSMLDAYEELHAKYDLGDCEATIAARAAMSNPEKQ